MNDKDRNMVLVVFRKNQDGQIIAILPEMPGDRNGAKCIYLYEADGQLCEGSDFYAHLMNVSRPVKPQEYRPFLKLLQKHKKVVNLIQHATDLMHRKRQQNAQEQQFVS